jgi:hypothetical protein
MINANVLVTPTRIRGEKGKRVNRHNVLKLSGYGSAISSALEFAVDHISRPEPNERISNLGLSFQITVYPRDALASPDDARLIRSDTLARLDSQANKIDRSRLIVDDPAIFQLTSDGRPVVLEVFPIPGGSPTVNFAIYFPHGSEGPCLELVCIPMDYVVDQESSLQNQFVVYCHTITPALSDAKTDKSGMNYIGITKQGWRRRFDQHLSNARLGSPLLFHRALRDHYRLSRVCSHRILTVAPTEREAMDSEEEFVRGTDDPAVLSRFSGIEVFAAGTLYPKGLNMIPGGYEGLRVLHKLGALERNKALDVDQREEHLIKIMRRGEKEGKANPLVAALWLDEDYATKIICGRADRLKPNQIAQARYLGALGRDVPDIARTIGAKSESQVERLLKGQTYSRITKR